MPQPPPMGLDFLSLAWAAGFSFAFSLSLLPDRWRKQPAEERKIGLFWGVIVETLVGGVVGGVVFAVAIPEHFAWARGEGTRAALSIVGAALGPHLGAWFVRGAPQAIPALIQKHTGIKVSLEGGKGDDVEKKS